jgi:AbrB family looped-hinge helix DNA binding protein
MKTTIDAAGRLVIPREARREAGLVAGTTVEVRVTEGQVILEPSVRPVRLVREGRLTVARATDGKGGPRLTGESVERTRTALRRRG